MWAWTKRAGIRVELSNIKFGRAMTFGYQRQGGSAAENLVPVHHVSTVDIRVLSLGNTNPGISLFSDLPDLLIH